MAWKCRRIILNGSGMVWRCPGRDFTVFSKVFVEGLQWGVTWFSWPTVLRELVLGRDKWRGLRTIFEGWGRFVEIWNPLLGWGFTDPSQGYCAVQQYNPTTSVACSRRSSVLVARRLSAARIAPGTAALDQVCGPDTLSTRATCDSCAPPS